MKRMKQNEKRRQRNRAARSNVRSTAKAAGAAVSTKGPEAKATVHEAIRILDRAVTKGLLHRNTAGRKKSALARKLSTLA
jgi:small subunit ribosomal protein S20